MHVKDENEVFVPCEDFAPVLTEVIPSPEIFLLPTGAVKFDPIPGISFAGPAVGEASAIASFEIHPAMDTEDISVIVWDPNGNKSEAKLVVHENNAENGTGKFFSAVFTPQGLGRIVAEVFVDGLGTGLKVAAIVNPVTFFCFFPIFFMRSTLFLVAKKFGTEFGSFRNSTI
jgi:hypothetical protein